jgi:hypothetical protein
VFRAATGQVLRARCFNALAALAAGESAYEAVFEVNGEW